MNIDFNNNNKLKPGLYIVATPIGHLEDITVRALKTLNSVDLIICEDTRVTSILLNKYSISKKLFKYNDHSNVGDRNKIMGFILEKQLSVALVSDAGTPMISDPGYKLIKQLIDNNCLVTSAPGACAAINALALSGAPSNKFTFYGFLPIKTADKKNKLEEILKLTHTSIFYETSKKANKLFSDICSIDRKRKVIIVREMTKVFEEVIIDQAETFIDYKFRGELVIIIPPDESNTHDQIEIDDELINIIRKLSTKDGQSVLKIIYPKLSMNYLYNLLK